MFRSYKPLIIQTRQLYQLDVDKLFTLLLFRHSGELSESAFQLCHPPPAHQRVMRICCAAQQLNIRELQMWNVDDGGVEMPKSLIRSHLPPNIQDFTGIREKMTDFTHQF